MLCKRKYRTWKPLLVVLYWNVLLLSSLRISCRYNHTIINLKCPCMRKLGRFSVCIHISMYYFYRTTFRIMYSSNTRCYQGKESSEMRFWVYFRNHCRFCTLSKHLGVTPTRKCLCGGMFDFGVWTTVSSEMLLWTRHHWYKQNFLSTLQELHNMSNSNRISFKSC